MSIKVPPHVAWPAFVVALLLVSVGASVYTLVRAGDGGGAQVIDDYYQKGAAWDAVAARRAASAALGWKVQVAVQASGLRDGLRAVDVVVRDSTGRLVEDLRGTLRVSRPHLSRPVAEVPLQPVPGAPGRYRQQAPVATPGLWDFEVEALRGPAVFVGTVRVEVSGP